jgi:membrane-associated protease RseP (regulator of RpoE activity)
LGVSLADVSAELRERYKNNVQAGAFIVQVVPESVADKAGLKAGDCVTAFGQKEIRSAQDLIEAVNNAATGEHDLTVMRGGAALSVKIVLGEKNAESADAMWGTLPGFGQSQGGWWRQGPVPGTTAPTAPIAPTAPDSDAQTKIESKSAVEIQAGVLEMTNELSEALKLTAVQRTKMDQTLAECRRKLNELAVREPAQKAADAARVREFLKEQIAEAEKAMAGVLSAEQLNVWRNFRETRDSLTIMVRREQKEIRSNRDSTEGF